MKEEVTESEKKLAAAESIKWIADGMVVGLGSGSTVFYAIEAIGKLIENGMDITGIPSSVKTEAIARDMGIPLAALEKFKTLDITIDGADEFNPDFQLIKGGGGALLREKILDHNSKLNIIIADSTKQVHRLGKFRLPLETLPFATNSIRSELEALDLNPVLRLENGKNYTTDQQNFIIDIAIMAVDDLTALNDRLIKIPGVVETGLFLHQADVIIVGKENNAITLRK